jgi:hypothetical protein
VTAGTTPVTIQSNHILRVAELLDYLSDTAEAAEDSLEGDELAEHQRERMSARHWARELRDAVARQKPASGGI